MSNPKANPAMITKLASRSKCFMCKHKFDKPFILPVEKIRRGAFQPNFNAEMIFHLQDTHGIPNAISKKWLIGAVYSMELTDFGAKGLEELYDE